MSIPGACVLVARFPGAGVAAVKALPGEVDSVLGLTAGPLTAQHDAKQPVAPTTRQLRSCLTVRPSWCGPQLIVPGSNWHLRVTEHLHAQTRH